VGLVTRSNALGTAELAQFQAEADINGTKPI
jgi:hypothetical protein